MAYGSAFGISGYDPIMSAVEGFISGGLSSYFGKKSSKKALKQQIALATWQALNMPKLQKQGLIAAGYNPLLAVSGGVGSQPLPSAYNAFMPLISDSNTSGGFDASAFAGSKQAFAQKKAETKIIKEQSRGAEIDNSIKAQSLRQARADADVAEDEASARQVQAHVAEVEALATLDALSSTVNRDIKASPDSFVWNHRTARGVYSGKGYDRFVEKLRNAVDWDVKSKSNANFWWRRGIEAIHGINEASSAYDSYRGTRTVIRKK